MIIFDIETNDWLHKWDDHDLEVLSISTLDTKTRKRGINVLNTKALGGHNIISYDIPVLKRIGLALKKGTKVYDTYLLACMIFPEEKNSLEAWGERFGYPKQVVDSFRTATQEEIDSRCEGDCEITLRLWNHLLPHLKGLENAYNLEAFTCKLITEQEDYGVNFDIEKAESYLPILDKLMLDLREQVEPSLPDRGIPESQLHYPPKKKFLADGTPSKLARDYFGDKLYKSIAGSGWCVDYGDWGAFQLEVSNAPLVTHETMTLDHNKELKEWLISKGWEPTFWNHSKKTGDKTSPKIALQGVICPNLVDLGDKVPDIKAIVDYNSYKHRRSMLKSMKGNDTGFLNHPRLAYDGRLPAGAATVAATTGRMQHRVVANIPRPSSLFGREIRELFIASEGKKLVGWDAASLEDRCKAHYVHPYDPKYALKLLDPSYNVHDENCKLWFNLTPDDADWKMKRDLCKNGQFALTYGCTAPKLGETLKVSKAQGKILYDEWWDLNKPLLLFKEALQAELKKNGFIRGLDGRPLKVAAYKAVNYACQSMGAIIMKRAMIMWHMMIAKRNIPANQVIHYHDEAVAETILEYAELTGELGIKSIELAGEYYKTNVPMTGHYIIGDNWAEVH